MGLYISKVLLMMANVNACRVQELHDTFTQVDRWLEIYTLTWTLPVHLHLQHSSPCLSIEGIKFFGTERGVTGPGQIASEYRLYRKLMEAALLPV